MRYEHISSFDLDQTLISSNICAEFFYYLLRKKIDATLSVASFVFTYWRYKFFTIPLKQLHEEIFERYLLNKPLNLLNQHIPAFLKECLSPSLYMPTYTRLRRAQHLGHLTILLSSSPEFLIQPVAKFLGFDLYKGSQYKIDDEGKFSNITSVFEGKDKAHELERHMNIHNVSKHNVTTYSDSILDIDFLLSSGNAIAVNPDRKLLEYSKREKWQVL